MTSDREPLDERQCLRLLADMSVGRVVYTVRALPAVLPVRFRLDGDGSLLLRAPAGSEVPRAVHDAVIAFEVGEVSGADGAGWSVTVLGTAQVLPGKGGAAPEEVLIRLRPEVVTGRVLESIPAPPR
ncbi:pyridoxamine 5'-phosphate oxidase family protein [Kitasatospora mediocidica]|uniref:pyridoxamine 5'-phosphate oxidase family protein n=1 Tax=Kitasatospora mediocidica TaxID=58352 RepID=UPI00055B22C0|nr:pyridoxamine 5'-phosphate oxidase family protein [Kitasatospora mediocidica]